MYSTPSISGSGSGVWDIVEDFRTDGGEVAADEKAVRFEVGQAVGSVKVGTGDSDLSTCSTVARRLPNTCRCGLDGYDFCPVNSTTVPLVVKEVTDV